jgi:hypothetical protein
MTFLLRKIGLRGAILATATVGITAAVAQIVELPEGPGKTVVLGSCVDCHDAGKITAVRHSSDEWAAVVTRMVDHGAALSLEEQTTVVKYLSANFGAAAGSSAAPAPTGSPSQAGPAPAPTSSPSPPGPAQPSPTRSTEAGSPSAPSATKAEGTPR